MSNNEPNGKIPSIGDHEVEIALAEYDACSNTRNHYDTVRWSIGSIFIAVSLGLFGFSFSDSIGNQLVAAVFTFLFSLSLILVWYLYSQHVNPYVITAVLRAHEIEKSLYPNGPKLNKTIWEKERKVRHINGVKITLFLFSSVVGLWILRIMGAVFVVFGNFTSDCLLWITMLGIIYIVILVLFGLLHREFNSIKIHDEISKIWKGIE